MTLPMNKSPQVTGSHELLVDYEWESEMEWQLLIIPSVDRQGSWKPWKLELYFLSSTSLGRNHKWPGNNINTLVHLED